jgi:glycosyltransferase involved in cell wall biosynthesis
VAADANRTGHVAVLVTSSYPRFPGDTVGTFMEPIAHGLAARGHEVHVVAPWHRLVRRPGAEGGVRFHFYRYAPIERLNVFGYSGALRADVTMRRSAWAVTPLALAAGCWTARRVARTAGASIVHGHWVVPGGATARMACPWLPLVVSLHGSDVYVAERYRLAGRVARGVLKRAERITACSEDLRVRALALGARPDACEVIPYGVDVERFRPSEESRAGARRRWGLPTDAPLVVAVGRFVRKKGFEHLLDAMATLAGADPPVHLALAGAGDLEDELRRRTADRGLAGRVHWPGLLPHDQVATLLAAADVVAVPSVRDEAGNVDGLPNVLLEALASGAGVVATSAGGIGSVVRDGANGLLVPERDAAALADAIRALLESPERRRALGEAARREVAARFGWDRVAERFERVYDAALARHRARRPGP